MIACPPDAPGAPPPVAPTHPCCVSDTLSDLLTVSREHVQFCMLDLELLCNQREAVSSCSVKLGSIKLVMESVGVVHCS